MVLVSHVLLGAVRARTGRVLTHDIQLHVTSRRCTEGADTGTNDMALPQQVELFEKSLISQSLANHHGRITHVCEHLGLPRKTLYDKLRKYGLRAEDYRHNREP